MEEDGRKKRRRKGRSRNRGEERKEGKKGRKKGKKERKGGKEDRREHLSWSFTLTLSPHSHPAASAAVTSEVAAHGLSCPLPTLFGLHISLCSPLGFSGPTVRQDFPFNFPYPSRDQPTMLKEKYLMIPK